VIAGAALDVLPVEPPDLSDPILSAPNLVLTNHDAWYSETALVMVRRLLAERCSAYLNGDPVPTIVNAGESRKARDERPLRPHRAGRRRDGAGGGLGTPICTGLAAFGADVALLDIDEEALNARRRGSRPRDGRRSCSPPMHRTSERHRGLRSGGRALRPGGHPRQPRLYPDVRGPEELTLDDWEKAFRINTTSYFLCCREAGRRMIASGAAARS
jgi:hypothetical protein